MRGGSERIGGKQTKCFDMDIIKGWALLRRAPERYATTGLDWGSAADIQHMAVNLQQALTAILGEMQVCRDAARRDELRGQLLRVDARASVLDRVSLRKGTLIPPSGQDVVCRLALEKMADSLEAGATGWTEAEATNGSRVYAGAMLEVGVRFAGAAQREGILRRYVRGPHAALAALAVFVANGQDCIEMEDLPHLADLVSQARAFPAREILDGENTASVDFRRALSEMGDRLQERVERFGWDERDV